MPKIYDNIHHQLADGLNESLRLSERTDFCVGYFNLRGWKQVADSIDQLSGQTIIEGNDEHHRVCRLLVGMQRLPVELLRESYFKDDDRLLDLAEANKLKKKLALEFRDQLTIGTPTDSDEIALRKLARQLKEKKVVVKLHLKHPLHAKLYLAYSADKRIPVVGFLGSSNLTMAGLVKQGELNIDVLEQDAASKLVDWFENRWNDRWCLDITNELIEVIETSWAADRLFPPYYIYLKIAYHLSREARSGISEFKLPKIFEKELLDFQQKAVLVAAHHLHKRNGVVIGDVVGLGKTITATALAKMFEDDFFLETLIICPKNLVTMWEDYAHTYQLRAKVISQSQAQTILPKLRRYRLVIIDESHNMRNDQGSRYRAIKSYLEENDSKVILLTATPYNKTFLDLSNQLRLFISDEKDLGISPERYINEIGGLLHFKSRHTETYYRSIKAFEKSGFADDWRELMRLYLVRRTRSFIKNNYATTDPLNERKFLTFSDGTRSYFPDRLPKRVLYPFDPDDQSDIYARLYSARVVILVNNLELPRYGLEKYLHNKPIVVATPVEATILKNLSKAGRRLMGFCRTNLFKRLESSGYAFLLSLSRHALRNYIFVHAIQNGLELPIGNNFSELLDEFIEDGDIDSVDSEDSSFGLMLTQDEYLKRAERVYRALRSPEYKKRFAWIRSEFFAASLEADLVDDAAKILQILELGKDWDPNKDRQLNALHDLITAQHPTEKVLVFTQYADTAYYLKKELQKRGIKKLDFVTGNDEDPTAKAYRFSPVSNKKTYPEANQIRVLIATDVLSEGQNLQDAHIVVNYDLPWAIIRLIQRAGRVDRIGQKAEQILCYSFLPEEGLDQIINLRTRLSTRIKDNAEVVGSDETFFDGDPVNLNDLYNEAAGILDGQDDDTEVDLASLAYQIWKNAVDANPELARIIPDSPNVLYGTKTNDTENPEREGVIVYARTSEDNDSLAWIDAKGTLITQSQHEILKCASCTPDTTPLQRLTNHHDLVRKGIDKIREVEQVDGGSLGRKTGVKYRVYMRLDRFCKENEGTLFVTETLKRSVDDILKFPMKEFSRETIGRQLKAGISDIQLAELVVSLREDDKLVITEEVHQQDQNPQIICSMGLINS